MVHAHVIHHRRLCPCRTAAAVGPDPLALSTPHPRAPVCVLALIAAHAGLAVASARSAPHRFDSLRAVLSAFHSVSAASRSLCPADFNASHLRARWRITFATFTSASVRLESMAGRPVAHLHAHQGLENVRMARRGAQRARALQAHVMRASKASAWLAGPLVLPGLGAVKLRGRGLASATPRLVTVSLDAAGRYWVSFAVEERRARPRRERGTTHRGGGPQTAAPSRARAASGIRRTPGVCAPLSARGTAPGARTRGRACANRPGGVSGAWNTASDATAEFRHPTAEPWSRATRTAMTDDICRFIACMHRKPIVNLPLLAVSGVSRHEWLGEPSRSACPPLGKNVLRWGANSLPLWGGSPCARIDAGNEGSRSDT